MLTPPSQRLSGPIRRRRNHDPTMLWGQTKRLEVGECEKNLYGLTVCNGGSADSLANGRAWWCGMLLADRFAAGRFSEGHLRRVATTARQPDLGGG